MHAICHALDCHVHKVIHMLGGFHITAYVESCTCYMPKLLHMHMIGVASSQSYMCHIFMLHWHHVLSGVAIHKILCIDSATHHDPFKNKMYIVGWIYMLPLHASNGILAIFADAFIVESMLLIRVPGRYYGVHNTSNMHTCTCMQCAFIHA
jgi:hypothetical protein